MKTQLIPVAVLVRLSTSRQEVTRQVSELRSYAETKGYEVKEVCKEQVSGMAEARRKGHRIGRPPETSLSPLIESVNPLV